MRNNLISFRKKIGLTQTDFGNMFGLTPQKVCNIEKGMLIGSAKFWLMVQKKFNLTNEQTLDLMELS